MANSFATFEGAIYPPANQTAEGNRYGDGVNVIDGTLVVGAGTPLFPPVGETREGTQFGIQGEGPDGNGQFFGTSHIPPQSQVGNQYGYGADRTEFVGTLIAGTPGVMPDRVDVRLNTPVGVDQVGLLESPRPAVVLLNETYGSNQEYIGTLQSIPGGIELPPMPPVTASGQLRDLIVGDAYRADFETAFIWDFRLPEGVDPLELTAWFSGRPSCSDCAASAWEWLGTITQQDGTTYRITVEATSEATALIAAGEYAWNLQLRGRNFSAHEATTIQLGAVNWVCP